MLAPLVVRMRRVLGIRTANLASAEEAQIIWGRVTKPQELPTLITGWEDWSENSLNLSLSPPISHNRVSYKSHDFSPSTPPDWTAGISWVSADSSWTIKTVSFRLQWCFIIHFHSLQCHDRTWWRAVLRAWWVISSWVPGAVERPRADQF